MSYHKQLHAMVGINAKLTLRPKLNNVITTNTQSENLIRQKMQNYLNIKDYKNETPINDIDPSKWEIANVSLPFNNLPRGTIYRHLTFIPPNTPDFRLVDIAIRKNDEDESIRLTSKTVIPKTITKNEDVNRSIVTFITGTPNINFTRNLSDLQTTNAMANEIAEFMTSQSTVGESDLNKADFKLAISKRIKNTNLPDDILKHLYKSLDEVFNRINDDIEISGKKIIANNSKAEDVYNYIVQKLLFK